MIKAIETRYNGYRFRSRLEARWAVFFDELNMPYEYEKEGFIFGDGQRYLPDFWLPSLNIWMEIKGQLTTLDGQSQDTRNQYLPPSPELMLCEAFRDAQNWPVACSVGSPGEERIWLFGWDSTDSSAGSFTSDSAYWCYSNGVATIHPNLGKRDREYVSDNLAGITLPWFSWPIEKGYSLDLIEQAQEAAKSARFEFNR
jgi:hypothetical protein